MCRPKSSSVSRPCTKRTLQGRLTDAALHLAAKNIFKDRGLDQYCANVLMKVNLKLCSDGNWDVAPVDTPLLDKKAILMGADGQSNS